MRSRALLALLSAGLALPHVAAAQSRQAVGTGCSGRTRDPAGPPSPSIAQLQAWTAQYYPDLAAKAKAPARLVVGFIINEQCRVLRHSVGFLPEEYSDDIVLSLFPDATRARMPAGVGDAVPMDERGRTMRERTRLVAAWLMQASTRSSAREHGRLRADAR